MKANTRAKSQELKRCGFGMIHPAGFPNHRKPFAKILRPGDPSVFPSVSRLWWDLWIRRLRKWGHMIKSSQASWGSTSPWQGWPSDESTHISQPSEAVRGDTDGQFPGARPAPWWAGAEDQEAGVAEACLQKTCDGSTWQAGVRAAPGLRPLVQGWPGARLARPRPAPGACLHPLGSSLACPTSQSELLHAVY